VTALTAHVAAEDAAPRPRGFVDTLATDPSPHTLEEKGSDIYGKLT
jgi:hypothetical protein